jgi:squalene-associated FAD-dependent desaturase
MSSKSVIVIGGGLAGLAAGVALAEAGWRTRLFEQRPFLGGRAASFVMPDDEHIDNCQHVTFGCCTNLEDFYRRVGSADKIRFFNRLLLIDPQGRRGELRAGMLPAPLHLAGSFATFSLLTVRDKLCIARAMLDIWRNKGRTADCEESGGISMLEWLRRRRQTPGAIRRFWGAVLVSALAENLDKVDARYGLDVFWKSVLSNRTGYRMGVPAVPLAELYDGCKAAIENQGGEVALRSPARGLRFANGRIAGMRMDDGREETADAYVIAVPHFALPELLPGEILQREPGLAHLDKLTGAPITGVHFWFDRTVMPDPFVTVLDCTTQWIFNKTALYENSGRPPLATGENRDGQYLQIVISASYDLLERSRQEIIELCLREVRQVLPAARDAVLKKATVIKEVNATFSPAPGCDRWRPKQQTSIPNLFLAGDWTDTGWPATMEGAVRSGYLAAEAVLRMAGAVRTFLRPDLDREGLSSLWRAKEPAARTA